MTGKGGPEIADRSPDGDVTSENAAGRDVVAPAQARGWYRWVQPLLATDALWFGLLAIVLGFIAQHILTPNGMPDFTANVTAATRWYILAVAILIIGWAGSYTNLSLVRVPATTARGLRAWLGVLERTSAILLGLAVLLNLLAVVLLRHNWYSLQGGILWVVSLALVVVAYLEDSGGADREGENGLAGRWRAIVRRLSSARRNGEPVAPGDGAGPTLPMRYRRRLEVAALLAVMIVALIFRLWRLGDLGPGMHGDEGEAGTQALSIDNGNLVSPFMRGWFNQPNFYYWSLAICMKIFGTGLFGLRSFALLCGLATVLFVYLAAWEMFGLRAAVIAGFFIAFQSADLLFSRQQFSNDTVPAFEAAVVYFTLRGLRTRRHLDFVIAGFAAGFAIYYFAGGRLIGPVAVLFLLYLAVVHRPFLRAYWSHALAFGIAAAAIATPWLAFNQQYPLPSTTYPNDRFIWLHHADLAVQYGTSDWRTILWDQLTRTLSIITHGIDVSAMSALDFPIARPLEAVLIVLGLAWALWRWRDSRFALISLWFWASIIAGGVLTVDAPNLPRILGILPILPLAIAAVLDHLWLQFSSAALKLRCAVRWPEHRAGLAGQWIGGAVAAGAIIISGVQNKQTYLDHYLNSRNDTIVTAQALYVQQHGLAPFYYDLGAPVIYWTHGDNRFINQHALGEDMANPSSLLPITDNGPSAESDANFMVWPVMYDYLHVLQVYYPGGKKETIPVGDAAHQNEPLISYSLTSQQIDRHRVFLARYVPARGRTLLRRESRIGLAGAAPPGGLTYPVRVTWSGALVAPSYNRYRFRLSAAAGTTMAIDNVQVISPTSSRGSVVMAQGVHSVRLTSTLATRRSPVSLSWAVGTGGLQAVPRRYLWDGQVGEALQGDITLHASPLAQHITGITERRIDGFLGFRSTPLAFSWFGPMNGRWSGTLHVRRAGRYGFSLNSLGTSDLLIDGRPVVSDIAAGASPNLNDGEVRLSRGHHSVVIAYSFQAGVGYLECWWTPPGGTRQLFVTPDLRPSSPGVTFSRHFVPPRIILPPPTPEPLGDQE